MSMKMRFIGLMCGVGLYAVSGPGLAQDISFRRTIVDRDFHGDGKAIGDLDGDKLADIVIGGAELVWYRAPAWDKAMIADGEDFGTDIEVADLDNDGDLDVVAPDQLRADNVLWFENPRPGGEPSTAPWRKHVVGTFKGAASGHPHDLAIGDIDGNGTLDLVTRRGNTTVWLQATPRSWVQVDLPGAQPGYEGTALGDLDKDGDLDVVLNGYWMEAPARLTNGAAWIKHTIEPQWPSDASVAVADMNQDGRLDVVLARSERAAGRLSWFQATNPVTGPWSEHVIAERLDHVHTLQTGDVDNDGDPDVIFAEMAQSPQKRVGFFRSSANGRDWALQVVDTVGSHNAAAGDIGGDGDLDIVGSNWQGNPVYLWENLSSGWQPKGPQRGGGCKDSAARDEPELRRVGFRDDANQAKSLRFDQYTYIQIADRKDKYGTWATPGWMKYFGLAAGNLTSTGFKDVVSGRSFYKNPGGDMTGGGGNWRRVDFGFNVDR